MGPCEGYRQLPMYVDSRGGITRGGCPVCGRNPRVTKAGKVGWHKPPDVIKTRV